MKDLLTGKSDSHIIESSRFVKPIHREIEAPLERLAAKAKDAGFDIQLTSGFRSFDRQLAIWNAKACGDRNILDDNSCIVDINKLDNPSIVKAIMRWSAIPGATRHHWGTDIDVYDANKKPEDYEVQLVPEECVPEGMFGEFHLWLDERIKNNESEGFFRPYEVDLGGVAPEKWHLSYAPLSKEYRSQYTIDFFLDNISNSDIFFNEVLMENAEDLYNRYVNNIWDCPF